MEFLIFWVIFEVFGDILEDFWRTFEEFWRNWFVEEKIKNFRKVDNEPFWWPQRPLQPPNSLRGQNLPQIWDLWPKLHMKPCLFGLLRPFLERSGEED